MSTPPRRSRLEGCSSPGSGAVEECTWCRRRTGCAGTRRRAGGCRVVGGGRCFVESDMWRVVAYNHGPSQTRFFEISLEKLFRWHLPREQRTYQKRAAQLSATDWSDTPTSHDPHNAWLHDDTFCIQFLCTLGLWHFPSGARSQLQTCIGPNAGLICGQTPQRTRPPHAALARAEYRSKMQAALSWPGAFEPLGPRRRNHHSSHRTPHDLWHEAILNIAVRPVRAPSNFQLDLTLATRP